MSERLVAQATQQQHDRNYHQFERLIASRIAEAKNPLFTTDAKPDALWAAYLYGIPGQTAVLESYNATTGERTTKDVHSGERQHYNCITCRRFIQKFGGLVTISEDGVTEPLLWGRADAPDFFADALNALYLLVSKAKVTGVYMWGDKVWGTPSTKATDPSRNRTGVASWSHLHGTPANVHKGVVKTAAQDEAEKKEEHHMLRRGLADYPIEAVVQAVRVLDADAVDRSEKTLGVAKWFLKLHDSISKLNGATKNNIVWRAVATAPPGWCHIRSTMIATLLDDVVAGLPYESIKRKWNEKMHPLQYQRPTAPPSERVLKQANALVEKLQTAGALKRRFATLEDVKLAHSYESYTTGGYWMPSNASELKEEAKGGAFDHLMPSKAKIKEVQLPPVKMTWDAFSKEVLPATAKLEMMVPSFGSFYGMVTAVDPEAPPILQWDGLEGLPRNSVSWYLYHSGSYANGWNLVGNTYASVRAVCRKPCHWQKPEQFPHQGTGVCVVLDGARDVNHTRGGSFFPECLKSEYHGIRSTMEAFAQSAVIAGKDAPDQANGYLLDNGQTLSLRATDRNGKKADYSVTY